MVVLVGSDCGANPEAETCAPNPGGGTCEDIYCDIAGYELCQETDNSCIFYREDRDNAEISCAAICAFKAALCLNEYEEGEPNVCDVGASAPCDEPMSDAVCECGIPSNGGTGGSSGSGGSEAADVFADEVDESLTGIDDDGCLGNCVGEPANATGPPDFVLGQGNSTSVSLGPGGVLGLVFVDEFCVVDGDPNTPDIIVYEVGGVSREDFSVDVVVDGSLTGTPVHSIANDEQPERRLDLTSVIGGAGTVQRIQIIDIDGPPDEPEEPGFEEGWGLTSMPSRASRDDTDTCEHLAFRAAPAVRGRCDRYRRARAS